MQSCSAPLSRPIIGKSSTSYIALNDTALLSTLPTPTNFPSVTATSAGMLKIQDFFDINLIEIEDCALRSYPLGNAGLNLVDDDAIL